MDGVGGAPTALATLERIGTLAGQMTDERVAEILNAEGHTTRMGLPWTAARIQRVRHYHRIATTCPLMPRDEQPRGDGSVLIGAAAAILGVVPSALDHWRKWGFLPMEQAGEGSPFWVRLTPDDRARLDGTFAAQGCGQWHLREAQAILQVTKEQIWEKARRGEIIAYRARYATHWEWRVSRAEDADQSVSDEAKIEERTVAPIE